MQIISLGHDEKMFDTTSRPFLRQLAYASQVERLTIVMPTAKPHKMVTEKNVVIEAVAAKLLVVRFFKYVLKSFQIVREQKNNNLVITTQNPFEFGIVGWFIKMVYNIPFEVQVHGDFYSCDYWRSESFGNQIRYYLGLFVLRRAQGVRVVGSRILKSLTSRGIESSKITVLPINTSLAPFLEASPRSLWSESDRLTIISVARFSREKNLSMLIRAFNSVNNIFPETQLVLVGEGSGERGMKEQISKLWPNVTPPVFIYPWQSAVASIMKASDIFVLTSDYEGYAMVLGEAMAVGLPIVTTDVGCVGDLCLDNYHALVISPRDEKALVSALSKLVADEKLRLNLGTAGRSVIEKLQINDTEYVRNVVASWKRLS